MQSKAGRSRLLASTALLLAATAFAGVASAQTAAPQAGDTSSTPSATTGNAPVAAQPAGAQSTAQQTPDAANSVSEVVVTGSILRRKLSDTAAPITTVTAADLDARGITTVQQGVQTIAANSAGALPNSFTSQGAFAAGASTASLRGLSSNSTLTLVDGLRMTYYPLADDGTRNFVDLNTIPDVIVDRIETLKDGASAIYGADAIAGVVNVITKKTYEGLTVKAEAGASQHGGGDENNFQALMGYGNLQKDGYNVYLGLEYEHDAALYNRDRGYPYNTGDLSSSCGTSFGTYDDAGNVIQAPGSRTCRTNSITNGLQFDNSFNTVLANIAPVIRQVDPVTGQPFGDYQLLNAAGGCGSLRTVTITPASATAGGAGGISNPVTLCQQDLVHDYGQISPDDKRFSASFRATKALGGDAQAYFAANYYQNDVISRGTPQSIRQQASPGPLGLAPYSTALTPGITLPVYVCASGINCNASNGTLNPNNPYAGLGEQVSIRYLFGDIPVENEQFSQTYRLATGVNGSFDLKGKWNYAVDATYSESNLRNTANGYIYIDGLLQAVATGAYNFVDPASNTQAVRNLVSPTLNQYSTSKLGQIQGTLQRDLFELPGGPLQLGLGASFRFESINNPTENTDANGPTARYFNVNGFGAVGDRTTEGLSFELDAPILRQVDIALAGRYDNYSTGVDNFSPQVQGRIRPFRDWAPAFDKITLRATYSQGFRIPSFAEANSFPTTGFTNQQISSLPADVQAAFIAAHTVNGKYDNYGQTYSLGLTELANPNLKPERSSNFTAGFVIDPIRQLSLSFDFYRITKRDVITGDTTNLNNAITAYFAGQPIPTGYAVTAGIPDPNAPNATVLPGFVSYQFANLNQETTSGYDIGATARFNLPYGVKWTSSFDGNYVLRLNLITPDGTQHFAGTIGPYIAVSASGTPKFRANWTNSFAYGPATVALTAYFTDGYSLQAEDYGDTAGVCSAPDANGHPVSASAVNAVYLDGVTPVQCKVKPFWDFDAHTTYQVTHNLQAYLDISNLFDQRAPLDPTTYGGYQYNPAWANDGIYGRYFKVGLKATF